MTGPLAHPRERFDRYAQLLDLGQWRFEVDDFVVPYGAARWFPFPRCVRLAPDIDYRSWRNEYVQLCPGRRAHQASADLTIGLRAQGMGAVTVTVVADLDLRDPGEVVALRPDDLTGELHEAALVKAWRVLELIHRERTHRRAGRSAPVTAHDRSLSAMTTSPAIARTKRCDR